MGLLSEGKPLTWAETEPLADHVRKHGIQQLINQYSRLKTRTKDILYWGDEVEYLLVKLNHKTRKAKLLLKGPELLPILQQNEKDHLNDVATAWHAEYAGYMLEGTPGKPYGGLMAHFNLVETNMKTRREEILERLGPDEIPLTLTAFPRLGCVDFTSPPSKATPTEGSSRSLFFPQSVIFSGHPRFSTLTNNIRERRGEKIAINVPIYKDSNTPWPFIEDLQPYGDITGESQAAALPNNIYMDAMGFGMGNCCLQVTFQACNIDEARLLYDQLTPLCPILLALSAASPVYRGYLSDIDCRWMVISQAVDDRTQEERGLKPLEKYRFHINKSRYDSIDSYLSPSSRCYNNINMVYDKDICAQLQESGMDSLLAQHFAHLFIRDPVSLFREKIDQDDEVDTDHFELCPVHLSTLHPHLTRVVINRSVNSLTINFQKTIQNIQSTNWQTMRFKPPPPNSNIGWRVEFRPMEIQLSDFENAAYVVFIVLLTRVILTFKLNFLIPIKKVDENLKTAQKRDAVREGRYYFRKDLLTDSSPQVAQCYAERVQCSCLEDEYTDMSINEIINGKGDFPGLIPLMNKYVSSIDCDVDTRCTVLNYLRLISARASGELMTTARWIREFVTNHPEYKHDSVISDSINYDLIQMCAKITNKEVTCPELICCLSSKTTNDIPQAAKRAQFVMEERARTNFS